MSHEAFNTPAEFALQDFTGTYLGLAPSDESVVVFGEVEVTIDETGVIARYATGNGIEEFFTPAVQIGETDPAAKEPSIRDDSERARALRSGIDLDETRTFKVGSLDYIFATLTSPDIKMPTLIIEGTMGDETAPTMLFSPEQIKTGIHEAFVTHVLQMSNGNSGDMPRLANDGYAHNYRPEPEL